MSKNRKNTREPKKTATHTLKEKRELKKAKTEERAFLEVEKKR